MIKEKKFRARMKKEFGLPNASYDVFTLQELMSGKYDFNKYENWEEFSPLFDKTGAGICEGDIVKGTGIDGKVRTWACPSLIYFHHWQETQDLLEEYGDIEVIGNTTDNSALLHNTKTL